MAKKLGLINVKQTSSVFGQWGMGNSSIEKPSMGDKFSITLSEKGSSTPHAEDIHGNIWFLTSQNKIGDIHELTKSQDNQYTVLFSYTEKYTALGKEGLIAAKELKIPWTEDSSKFRGKAMIAYDPFLKKYVLKNILISIFDKEQWRPSQWTIIDNKKTLVTYGESEPKH